MTIQLHHTYAIFIKSLIYLKSLSMFHVEHTYVLSFEMLRFLSIHFNKSLKYIHLVVYNLNMKSKAEIYKHYGVAVNLILSIASLQLRNSNKTLQYKFIAFVNYRS